MKTGGSRWPAWLVALALSLGGGVLCVLLYFVIPELAFHGLPGGANSVRLFAPLTILFAAIAYASLVEDKPRYRSRVHLVSAGIVGGVACAFVLHALPLATPITLPVVALTAVIGAVLAGAGVFGWVARGLQR